MANTYGALLFISEPGFLPQLVKKSGVTLPPTGTITYTYDATGNKLRKVSALPSGTKLTNYISGIEYDGTTAADTLNFIQTEAGKAVHRATKYEYEYYLADNLGNTRVTFGTKTGTAVLYQQDDYYPFGLEINRSTISPKNEYLYNKKELQEETGIYDYGARFYDPVIGRWNTIDPLAEESRRWSTYNYVEDDPVRLTDPDGMKEMDKENREGLDAAEALFSSLGAKTTQGDHDGGDKKPTPSNQTAKKDGIQAPSKVPKVKPKVETDPKKAAEIEYNYTTLHIHKPTGIHGFFNDMKNGNFAEKFSYNTMNDFCVYGTRLFGSGGDYANGVNLDGTNATRSGLTSAGVNVLSYALPVGSAEKVLNAADFNVLYKGTGINSRIQGVVKEFNQVIRENNLMIDEIKSFNSLMGFGNTARTTIKGGN